MNRYSQIYSQIWFDGKYTSLSDTAKLMFLYVLTSPHGNMIGYYRLPVAYAACDLGWDKKDVISALDELTVAGMISYDDKANVVLIKNFLKYNPIQNESQAKGAAKLLDDVPASPLIEEFARCIEQHASEYADMFEMAMNHIADSLDAAEPKHAADTVQSASSDAQKPIPDDTGHLLKTVPTPSREGVERVPTPCQDPPGEQRTGTENRKQEQEQEQERMCQPAGAGPPPPLQPVPYQQIADLYNSICVSLPRIKAITEKRRKHIRASWKELGGDITLFEQTFRQAEESDFLSGRSGKWTGCNFDWLIVYNNMVKVMEGTYGNKEAGKLPQNLQNALQLVKKTDAGEPIASGLWEV